MIQAIGLTSAVRRGRQPAVEDLTFDARPGEVTVLLGSPGAGKSTALRLLLGLAPGRGVALFRGRPLSRVPHPAREVGVLLGDVPGHPGRSALGHLRMLAAASGVPAGRAEEVLDVVGLSGLADQRLGSFSRGMDRRLGLAAALLAAPHALVLDEPAEGLSVREAPWLRSLLRDHARRGGTVLVAERDPVRAAGLGDHVVTVDGGRLLADQAAGDFARTRLRPRVVVRSPHAGRLAAVLLRELPAGSPEVPAGAEGGVEVVRESGTRLAVFGSTCAEVGEVAFRHRVPVHQLAVETGDRGDPPADPAPSRPAAVRPPLPVVPRPGPGWPLRYELRRATGVPTGWWVLTAALLTGLAAAIGLALAGARTPERTLAGWPEPLPLPPVAVAAGLLGALSFGQEFRYPALAPLRAAVPCRLSLLGGKLLVTAVAALLLSCAGVALNHGALYVLFGGEAPGAGAWAAALAGVAALAVGCAWAGLLAAGVFRSTPAGLAAVAAVPLVLAPALRALLDGPVGRSLGGLPERLQALTSLPFASGVDRWLSASVRLASQPVGWALALSVAVLSCGYALLSLRRGAR